VLKLNYGRTDATAAEGDITGDGRVDDGDFVALKKAFGGDLTRILPITPDPADGGAVYADFSHVPLFTDGPDYGDIRQGKKVGDCYFLGTLAAYAHSEPEVLRQAIRPLADGTYAVRYYNLDGSEAILRIDADLPVDGAGRLVHAGMTPDGETWVALMEKAFCGFRYGLGNNSYASINAGWPEAVFVALTNGVTETDWVFNFGDGLGDYLAEKLDAGSPVTLVSATSDVGRIVGNHVYAVIDVEYVGAETYITVYNSWGFDGRGSDDNSNDGLIRLTADEISAAFRLVTAAV
jgi:hypothetical protein